MIVTARRLERSRDGDIVNEGESELDVAVWEWVRALGFEHDVAGAVEESALGGARDHSLGEMSRAGFEDVVIHGAANFEFGSLKIIGTQEKEEEVGN